MGEIFLDRGDSDPDPLQQVPASIARGMHQGYYGLYTVQLATVLSTVEV